MKQHRAGSGIILLLILVWLLIPLLVTIIYSLFQNWTGIIPRGFSLKAYAEIFSDPAFLAALGRTILICIIPILITILLVLLALFVTGLFFPGLERIVQIICMIPYTIQGVILSVSILSMYVANKTFLGNRLVMLTGAYCIIIFPYIYQGIRNGMRAVNMPVLIEAAETLGASRIYAYFRIIVPNIISSVVVSSLLAVGIIFGDYVLVRNLDGSAFQNIQIYLYQAMKSDSMKSSAVFVVIMAVTFAISAVVLWIQGHQGKHSEKTAK